MKFRKLTINVTLAIAATIGLQAVAHAETKYDFLAKQLGLQTVQPQAIQLTPQAAIQPESSAETVSLNQEGQTFFSNPPQLIRAAASQTGAYVPSTYEFTLTVPKDAGQPLKAVKVVQAQNAESIKFDVANSKAFVGDLLTASSAIRLASVGGEQSANPGEATIVFD